MEKDVALGKAGTLKLELVGVNAVIEFDGPLGITNTTTVPATALLQALNDAVDAKWPGTKAVADPVFGLIEKGVSALGGAAAPAAAAPSA